MRHDDLFADIPAIAETKPATATSSLTDFRSFARMGYMAIGLTFGGFGGWAALAPLDRAAVAEAHVAVTSDRKPVQHLEGGIIKEVLVAENQRVVAGQVLFRLQPVKAQSDAEILRGQLDGLMAQEARVLAEREVARSITFPAALLARESEPAVARMIADQTKQFNERRRSLEGQVEIYRRKIEQTKSDIAGRVQREIAIKAQLANMQTEISAVSQLAERGFYPRNKLLAQQREMFRMEGDLGLVQNEIRRYREVIEESQVQIRNIMQKQVEDAAKELADVRGKMADAREKLQVALDVLTRVEIKAPQSGILQGLKLQAVGAVVKPGEPIAEIITIDDGLIMTAKVSPNDVDLVLPGQKAEIKFPAFATRQRMATMGQVQSVSADAVIDPATKQPFYNARVTIDMSTLPKELQEKLTPGMPATVLISTGERTLLKYLVGPLFDAIERTMRER